MASCSSLLTEEHLLCPICLDVFTQPVSTPCGHNFCMSCISSYWGLHTIFRCPVCKEGFDRRPDLKVNTFISELTSQFMSLKVTGTQSQKPVQESASCGHVVLCDVCTDTKQTAVKSCLECLASYCDVHLEPHHRAAGLKRHTLLEPMSSLEDRICKEHARLLTRFCRDDVVLLCDDCCSLKHLDHNVISVQQAYNEAKTTLQGWEADVQQMKQEGLQKVKEMKELVGKNKTETKNVIAGSVQELAQLVSQIQQSQTDLVQVIEEQADGFFDSMGQTIEELQSTEMKIRELKQTEDNLYLLINMPKIAPQAHRTHSQSLNGLVEIYRIRKCLSKSVPQMQKLLKELKAGIEELSSSTDEPSDTYLKFMRQYVVDISLDPTTANRQLTISDDRKQVKFDRGSVFRRHQSPNRFRKHLAVLGDTALSTYKFYFEVFVGRKSEWCLGLATESIQRKKVIPRKPDCGLWAVWFKEDRFETFCCPDLTVHRGKVEQVGVYVRYETSSIYFYDVQTLTEIYSFTGCSFTEKLYPYFNPCNDEYESNLDPMIILPVKRTECM